MTKNSRGVMRKAKADAIVSNGMKHHVYVQVLTVQERRAKVWYLIRNGWTGYEIAKHFGVSHTTIYKDITKVFTDLKASSLQDAEAWRIIQVERIEHAHRAIAKSVRRGSLKAITVMVKLMEREAKLLGIDAPAKVDIEWRVRDLARKSGADEEWAVQQAKLYLKEGVV